MLALGPKVSLRVLKKSQLTLPTYVPRIYKYKRFLCQLIHIYLNIILKLVYLYYLFNKKYVHPNEGCCYTSLFDQIDAIILLNYIAYQRIT